jgi:hypothetical protein
MVATEIFNWVGACTLELSKMCANFHFVLSKKLNFSNENQRFMWKSIQKSKLISKINIKSPKKLIKFS